jgi:isoleucyl-tRNA synthetase
MYFKSNVDSYRRLRNCLRFILGNLAEFEESEKIIFDEDKRKPETDDSLVKLLFKEGYKIARRTVSKYREQLNIPVARLRKQL